MDKANETEDSLNLKIWKRQIESRKQSISENEVSVISNTLLDISRFVM